MRPEKEGAKIKTVLGPGNQRTGASGLYGTSHGQRHADRQVRSAKKHAKLKEIVKPKPHFEPSSQTGPTGSAPRSNPGPIGSPSSTALRTSPTATTATATGWCGAVIWMICAPAKATTE